MTAGMLPMLGVSPILGRHLTDPAAPPPPPPPAAPGAPPAPPRPPPPPQPVLLDYDAWQAHFGGDPDILDRTILLNGRATEVSGVLPRGFRLPTGRGVPQRADVYMPMRLFEIRNAWQFPTLVRLAAGVSVAEANARLDALAAALTAKYPEHYANTNLRFTFSPLLDDMLRETRPALRAALAGVLLLLLIAVANTTALVVARLKTRERDFAIRSAIGAGRGALVAEVLMESVILSGYGAMVGTAVAAGSAGAARAMVLQSVPRWEQVGVSWELIGYSAAFAMLGLFGAGLIPVWKVLRTAPSQLVRSASAQGGRAEGATSRLLLVGVQITLTLVLTFGAVQLVRSAGRLADVDIGFDAHVLTFRVPLDSRVHNTRPKQAVLYQRIRDRLRQVPGVQAVGANSHLPLSGATLTDGYTADLAGAASMDQAMANYHSVLPGYFESVRIPIVDGRDFSDAENANGEPVIVVDETLARAAFSARSPIGRTLKVGWGIPDSRIVGVVRPVRNIEVGRHVRPQIYVPYGRFAWQPLIFTVRASGDPLQLVDAAEAAIREIGPGRAVSGFQVLQDNVTAATSTLHAVTGLVILLATSAGVLSAVGLYSVIAFVVHQRRRATAIRSALGASPAQLLWQHVQTSGMVILIALPAGVALAAIAAPFLGPLVYGVNERDPISLAAAAVVATSAGVLGTYLPARRAVHVDPVRVLREE
jgi:putative ABC transport system permease protein